MEQLKLKVEERALTGSANANRARKQGKIPAVIYGKSGAKNLLVEDTDFIAILKQTKGKASVLTLEGGNNSMCMIKKTSRCSVTDKFLHVDFIEISKGDTINTVLPLRFVGESEGVKNENGVLNIHMHDLKVVCDPLSMPEFISVDVSPLQIGESIEVKGLTLPQGVQISSKSDADKRVVAVDKPTVSKDAAAAAEAKKAGKK